MVGGGVGVLEWKAGGQGLVVESIRRLRDARRRVHGQRRLPSAVVLLQAFVTARPKLLP